jgi:transcriptional regulator with XRE-family HTH domain
LADRLLARIRQLREARALTQEAFAEKAGLGYKYYQSVEAGRRRDIRLSTVEKLAKALELEPWELLNLEAAPLALADPKGNKFPATPRRATRKPRKR